MFVDRDVKPAVAQVADPGDELHIPMWWNPWRDGEGTRPVMTDTAAWVARVHARFPTRPGVRRVAEALAGQVPEGAGIVSLHGIKSSAHVSRASIAEAMASLQRAGLLELRTGIAIDRRDVRLIGA